MTDSIQRNTPIGKAVEYGLTQAVLDGNAEAIRFYNMLLCQNEIGLTEVQWCINNIADVAVAIGEVKEKAYQHHLNNVAVNY